MASGLTWKRSASSGQEPVAPHLASPLDDRLKLPLDDRARHQQGRCDRGSF
jgi:hypothetical protein